MDCKSIGRWTTLTHHLFAAGFAEACCVWVDFQGYMCMQQLAYSCVEFRPV